MSASSRFPAPSLFDELFRDISPGFFIKPLQGEPAPAHIKIEVKENKESYIVIAELPGIEKENIDVSIEANLLTIKATVQQEEKKTEDEKLLRSERYYGVVSRSFQLPVEINRARATASYEKGILTLHLPKQQAAVAHRLPIN